jgi:hypothetical protein
LCHFEEEIFSVGFTKKLCLLVVFLSFFLFSLPPVGLLQTLGRVMWSCLSGGGILYARTVYAHNKINARKEKEKKKKVKNGQREES